MVDMPNGKKLRAKAPSQKQKKIALITGSTSNLGRRLAKRLLEEGYEVRVGIRRESSEADYWKRVVGGTIPYVADLAMKKPGDERLVEDACRGVDVIFHLAGLTYEHQKSIDDFISVNVIGTENLLNAYLKANGNKPVRLIYVSSIRVYGRKRPGEVLTEDSELKPVGPYGRTKLMAEQVIRAFAEAQNPRTINYTILRLTQMYGPGYEEPYFLKVFKRIKEQRMVLIGDGSNKLALVHVDDVIDAMLLALSHEESVNHTYNITDGSTYTVRELYEKAAKVMDVPAPTKSINPIIATVAAKAAKANTDEMDFLTSDRIISIVQARKDLGYNPKRSVDKEGIEMVREFLKKQKK